MQCNQLTQSQQNCKTKVQATVPKFLQTVVASLDAGGSNDCLGLSDNKYF